MENFASSTTRLNGRVVSFDEAAGLGLVADETGSAHRFHCVAIADGTRTISVGASVTFSLVVRHGDTEATDVAYADADAQR